MITKKITFWGKEIEIQKADLVKIANIFFYCCHCKKGVHKEWKQKIVKQPNYSYMVTCPLCNRVEEIYF